MTEQKARYTLTYEPSPPQPRWDENPVPSVTMTLESNDASVENLLSMFKDFLAATGFPVDFFDTLSLIKSETCSAE
jgi:hypothetical protein